MIESTDSPVIEVSDLVRKFGERAVINDISFTIQRGETLVIMGGSGCGKSTLLRHIIGSMQPTSGSVKIFGEEITKMKELEIARVRRRFLRRAAGSGSRPLHRSLLPARRRHS